jgi:hypothetical protein
MQVGMRHAPLFAGVALVPLLPLGTAHTPAGTPKNYCEWYPDVMYHEYVGINGPLLPSDGNVTGDCDGQTLPLPEFDGHQEFAIGGAILSADHHSNTVCVEGALLYEVNGLGPFTAPCTTVGVSTVGYVVTVLVGTAGHIYTL